MKTTYSSKNIFSSVIFFVVLILEAILIDYLLGLILDHFGFAVINWFNSISIFWKIVIIFLGGGALFFGIMALFVNLSAIVNRFFFQLFPHNHFVHISSIIIFVANTLFGIKVLWDSFPSFSFWLVLNFILFLGFVLMFNSILLMPNFRNKD